MWTYESMCVQTDERETETVYFDQGMRKYIIVNAIMTFDQVYTLPNITILENLLGSGSCE